MTHTVYDERGNILLHTESEIKALYYGIQRQAEGRLTTVLLNGVSEIMFAPATPAGQRAETALEYQQRVQSKVKEEMSVPIIEDVAKQLRSMLRAKQCTIADSVFLGHLSVYLYKLDK